MFEYKRLELMLLKNSIMTLIPALITLFFAIFILIRFDVVSNVVSVGCENADDVMSAYESGHYNIDIDVEQLKSLGYDYIEDGEKTGEYYYSYMDGKYMIFLLKNDSEVLHDYNVRGRLVKDNTAYNYILEQCAADMGMATDQLKEMMYGFVVNESDKTGGIYRTIFIIIAVIAAAVFVLVIECIVWMIFPWMHPQIRKEKNLGDLKYAMRDINRQIHDATKLKIGDVIVTRKYFVISTLFKTDIIRLRDIEVISKHMERKRTFPFGREKTVYRLIISNSKSLFYQHEFDDETQLDKIMPLLKRKKRSAM